MIKCTPLPNVKLFQRGECKKLGFLDKSSDFVFVRLATCSEILAVRVFDRACIGLAVESIGRGSRDVTILKPLSLVELSREVSLQTL